MNMKYRTKPVVVEAIQWTGKNVKYIELFISHSIENVRNGILMLCLEDESGEYYAYLSIGDWIVKDSFGECIKCSYDDFEKTYERVEE